MNEIFNLLNPVKIPPVIKVKQKFDSTTIKDPDSRLRELLSAHTGTIRPGMRIAITGGSRGIDHYVGLMRTIVEFVRSRGGVPFIVPAMGSHGGSTAEGQLEILTHLGITEENVGAPVISSTEVVQIGMTDIGLPVLIDKNAYEADGIILLNRIKPHTAFRGIYESGLLKMLAIGLAKPKGAQMTHYLRLENMGENIIRVGSIALSKLPILFGVGSIENGYSKLAELHVLRKEEILAVEPGLLRRAFALMPRLYIDRIDALIVGEIGKDISGAGMDGNIVGRYASPAMYGGPCVTSMGLLDLTENSCGNGNGMGYADYTTARLVKKVNFPLMYMNTLTSTQPKGTMMPMVLDNDKLVFQACLRSCGVIDSSKIKLVVIKNTKNIDEIYMSAAAAESIGNPSRTEPEGEYHDIAFDEKGNLLLFSQRSGCNHEN